MGVSPLSCPPHQIQRLPFILEEECVVGCKPAVMPSSPNKPAVRQIHRPFILEEECVVGCKPAGMYSSPNTETTIHTRGGVCG